MLKQIYTIFLSFFLVISWLACDRLSGMEPTVDQPTNSKMSTPEQRTDSISINLTPLDAYLLPDTVTIHIKYDHVFKTPKQYRALPLLPILEQLIQKHNLDTTTTEVYFVCKDGYMPSLSLSKAIQAGGGFLAFQDLDAAPSQLWTDNKADNYSPYLLVWENVPYEKRGWPWPWGLTSLRLVENGQGLQSLFPADVPALADAFELFQKNCLKCHAINQIGGIMGPEFNDPKNITEYWSRENIVAFAKSPTSFRRNSKMMPIQHLKDEELHRIVDYLEYIGKR